MSYETLSDQQLLSLIIRERNGEDTVDKLFNSFGNLASLIVDSDIIELERIRGIGQRRAAQIKAVYELARRLYEQDILNPYSIRCSQDAANLAIPDLKFQPKEYFKIILLNTKSIVIGYETVSVGSLNSSIVHPREIFNPAIRRHANTLIGVHNHPSGDPTPSQEDINITRRLVEAGKLLGIQFLDHLIVGGSRYVSLKDKGIIE
ncbi:MAG: hypothetical protein K0S75_356 [Clostridia bacterium]|nr:hypothetical protein [Clostridia bacterium]